MEGFSLPNYYAKIYVLCQFLVIMSYCTSQSYLIKMTGLSAMEKTKQDKTSLSEKGSKLNVSITDSK